MKKIKLTQQSLNDKKAELEKLIAYRSQVADRIAEARDFGDLRENAEYDAARSEQAELETKIAELKDIIDNAEIISDEVMNSIGIGIGSIVSLERLSDKKKIEYEIVSTTDADPMAGKISDESPLGNELIGQLEGAVIKVKSPNGDIIEYKILKIGKH
ncbi:MAG: transcription elongation factor GreA [Candidatus Saccharibacteria bacterium]|nr:transcription elongation factor GreA [Candidatus Saccharibacteria bacterium]